MQQRIQPRQNTPPSYTGRQQKRERERRKKRTILVLVGTGTGLILALGILWALWTYVWLPQRNKEMYPLRYQEQIHQVAEEYSIDPVLLTSLVFCESSFRAETVNSIGATGLMQIMPDTGVWLAGKLGITDYDPEMLKDPVTNLRMGCWYLRFLLDRYDQQTREALTAFYAGQGSVDQWLADPAYSSDGKTLSTIPGEATSAYADKIMRLYEKYQEIYGDDLGYRPAGAAA